MKRALLCPWLGKHLPGALATLLIAAPAAILAQVPATLPEAARGVLRASQEAVLASNVSARVVDMPYREGDRFAKGAALVSFDCGRLQAEQEAARAAQAVEARNVQMQTELLRVQATGKAELDIANSRERERAAQVQAVVQQLRGCVLHAPFAGRVVENYARLHETPAANEKLLRVVSDGPLELHVLVPSKWLVWLRPGADFDVRVDETGDTVRAQVRRVSAAVDPVSQTVRVIAAIRTRPPMVLPGMSGSVLFAGAAARPAAPAASAAPAAPVAEVAARLARHALR